MSDEQLIEALRTEIDSRSNTLVSQDPTVAYLKGALDYANGNIKIREDQDGTQGTIVEGETVENTTSKADT